MSILTIALNATEVVFKFFNRRIKVETIESITISVSQWMLFSGHLGTEFKKLAVDFYFIVL